MVGIQRKLHKHEAFLQWQYARLDYHRCFGTWRGHPGCNLEKSAKAPSPPMRGTSKYQKWHAHIHAYILCRYIYISTLKNITTTPLHSHSHREPTPHLLHINTSFHTITQSCLRNTPFLFWESAPYIDTQSLSLQHLLMYCTSSWIKALDLSLAAGFLLEDSCYLGSRGSYRTAVWTYIVIIHIMAWLYIYTYVFY